MPWYDNGLYIPKDRLALLNERYLVHFHHLAMYMGTISRDWTTIFGGERSYHVRGRLVCGIQGAQGARISLWENRGRGTPFIYEEAIADIAGSFNVKAEIRNGAGFGGSGSNGYLILTINHNCEVRPGFVIFTGVLKQY
ncbi:Transthyretin-like family protein [Oesophagostomum dentatum]|uniref:Transthyretin-like family protein n=1 Tax=Oesophagostomum dentatum TaxID=61180 RepID=A0A0B1S520_OESDE|nr:Transthyretin-like family protein [Oesophagostomum dentatum]